MDPVTHLASGVLGAQAFRKHFPQARLFTPFCLLAAWIPDTDILLNWADPEWSLLYHRGLSTSLLGGLAMALALAGLYKPFSKKPSYWKTALLAYGLICVHIWLDLITSYGTQILAPFSHHRFSLDAVFIIAPLFTLGLLAFILFAALIASRRSTIAIWGLIFLFAYPIGSLAMGKTLETLVRNQYERNGFAFEEFEFIPDAFTPFYWKVITREKDSYTLTLANTLVPGREYPTLSGEKADQALLERLGRDVSMFRTWAWFARYPSQHIVQNDNGTEVVFQDLRFSSVHPLFRRLFNNGRDIPFTLKAELDDEGNLIGWEFNKTAKRFMRQAIE
ncbi:metal-dependent hydrolase [Salidesulfovibrio onnuriiensis]|uniref:metal-dependent hydrolase n=1 Tax=Salidesulfovibrio onnuriiensis TaxID=2583823 RepID=UPI0011CC2B30|nr:metal-dependent hydrolase [Salidesulfovibrio onnuriiensis]